MKNRILAAIAALLLCVCAHAQCPIAGPATVSITGSVYDANDTTSNGNATISWPTMLSPDSCLVVKGSKTVSITAGWFGGFNLASYYSDHFVLIFFILMGAGIVLGAVASVLAIHRYLKV